MRPQVARGPHGAAQRRPAAGDGARGDAEGQDE